MALTFTALANARNASSSTFKDTASVNPAAGSMVVVGWAVRAGTLTSMNTLIPSVSGNGLTWSLVTHQYYDASTRMMLAVHKGTGTPSAGTIRLMVDVSDRTFDNFGWTVVQVTGQGTTGIIQSTKSTKATGTAVNAGTLSAFGSANNADLLMVMTDVANGAITEENGWTVASVDTSNPPNRFVAYATNDTTPTATITNNVEWAAVAMEIEAAAVSSGGAPYYINRRKRRPRG